MTKAELRAHPAYRTLTAEERAAVDERLREWSLDAQAVAATTGGIDELDVSDLRFWLRSTGSRPWDMISLCPRPEQADAIFAALFDLAADAEQRDDRGALIDAARDFSRAVVVADGARAEVGFIRDEQLAALSHQLEALEALDDAWTHRAVLGVVEGVELGAVAEAIEDYRRQTTGIRGLFDRARKRVTTGTLDFVHGGLYLVSGSPEHEGRYEQGKWSNWSSTYEIRPESFQRPSSEDEIRRIVADARELRVVGGGHTFNASPLSPQTMLSLDSYDRVLEVDRAARTARVQGGIRLRDLTKTLAEHGLGLPVLGSTDTQSIAGLVATDLHGTGRDHGFLSEQLLSLRVIAADGTAQTVSAGDPLFHAAIGALGTCGVVSEVEVQLVDAFNLEKVTQMVDRAASERDIEAVLAADEHVSFYYVGGAEDPEAVRIHRWNRTDSPVTPRWEKLKTRSELTEFAISAYFPGVAELIAEIDEDARLSNLLAPDQKLVMPGGRGFGRKLFYRHDEIEFGVPIEHYRACLRETMAMLERRNFFSIVETRFAPASSRALLGPGVGRATAFIELATPLSLDYDDVYVAAEEIFRAHGGQPHIGKKTNVTAQDMLEIYGDRFVEFQAVRARQDPDGKFLNAFCTRLFGPV